MAMGTYWKIVGEVIEECDVILEVVDARMPHMTRNMKAEGMARLSGKPLIIVLNKADLINRFLMKEYKHDFQAIAPSVFMSTRSRRGTMMLRRKVYEIGKKRSRDSMIRVGVIGYPNTGKSSVINALAGKAKAPTSSKAGWTRGVQWVKADRDLMLLDTPGVIPFEEEDDVKKALMGIVNPTDLEYPEDAAVKIVELFLEGARRKLERLYGLEIKSEDPYEILEAIGEKRKMLKKGGLVDLERAYKAVILDWQKGKLLLSDSG